MMVSGGKLELGRTEIRTSEVQYRYPLDSVLCVSV